MKMLIVGDLHLKISKFEQACKVLKWIEKEVSKNKPDAVVFLGDTFDTHAVLRSEILSTFLSHIKSILKSTDNVIYILGNHDFYKPTDKTFHALQTFNIQESDLKKFTVIDNPTTIGDITYVPYCPNDKDFPKQVSSIVMCHQTFIGADYGYIRPEAGVNADDISADIIISGHVHKRQEFGKVVYTGTPYASNLNDLDENKGIMLFDSSTFERKFIESPFPLWRGVKYIIDKDINISDIHNDFVSISNNVDNWVLNLEGPKAEINAYLSSKEWKKMIKKIKVQVNPTYTDKVKKKIEITAVSADQIVNDYYDKVYNGSLDKTVLKNKSIEIIKSVN